MAQPATSRLLLTSLCEFISGVVRDYEFPAPDGSKIDCRVFLHGLPDDQDSETYPFVIVRWLEGDIESMEDSQTILRDSVALALGVYAPASQEQAGILLAELLDCLRRALWKKRIIANRFELVEPLRSQMVEQQRQQHHFHLATIETVWNYTWPPKALEEAGQSQLLRGSISTGSYSEAELDRAKNESVIWR